MNFLVNKRDLGSALQRVIGVVPTKTTIPILGDVLFEVENDRLTITGTDLEVSISTWIPVSSSAPGGVAIPAKIVHEIVRELPDVPLQISSDESNRVTINTDRGVYRISGEAKDEFPRTIVEEGNGGFSIDVDQLQRMINKTIFAVSIDELRTTLTGIYVQVFEDELRFVATDGHRLAKIVQKRFSGLKGVEKEAIVPTKAFHLVLRNSEQADRAEIVLGEGHLIFKLPQSVVYTKLIEGQFPNYERVIPTDNQYELVANREELYSSVRRVSLFSNVMTRQVRLSLEAEEMKIQAEDPQFGGEAEEGLSVRYSGEKMEVGYNATYIMDILRHLDTEEVIFKLKDGTSAGIIYPSEQNPDEELMMLLMPIRLHED